MQNSKLSICNDDFMKSREARSLRILSEYILPDKCFNHKNILHTVECFGSARFKPDHKYYIAAENFAHELAKLSKELEKQIGEPFYVCTGGGPGIMEAANKGAANEGSDSIGLCIELPHEQFSNEFISPHLNFQFNYFFMRKFWFLYHAKAIVVFPGGFGTLDELFETLTLIQTHKISKGNIPVLLYNKDFWQKLINFDFLLEMELISKEDLDLFTFFESAQEGIEILKPQLVSLMNTATFYHGFENNNE